MEMSHRYLEILRLVGPVGSASASRHCRGAEERGRVAKSTLKAKSKNAQ